MTLPLNTYFNYIILFLVTAFSSVNAQNYSSGGGPHFTCSGVFYDLGGNSNYGNNQSYTTTICPATAGQAIKIAFTAFNVEAGFDYLSVYDGNSTSAPMIPGSSFSGATSPGTVSATSINTSGCLTFRFVSDGSTTKAGWRGVIGCGAPVTYPTTISQQDCSGANTICGNQSVSGTSLGSGAFNDVNSGLGNIGCLNDFAANPNRSAEHQSHWFYFSPSNNGTLGMTIAPSAATTDYDWAIWGPYTTVPCPPTGAPLRCSSASAASSAGGATGLGSGAVDLSEGSAGNGWVAPMTVTAGQKYILMMDNWNATTAPYTLSWQLSGGASLNCALLPIELISFSASNQGDFNSIEWITSLESKLDFFSLERSVDGLSWETIHTTPGKNTKNQNTFYQFTDYGFSGNVINYYRLKQTEYTGKFNYSNTISVEAGQTPKTRVDNMHPNPTSAELYLDLFTANTSEALLQIFDINGKTVKEAFLPIEPGKNMFRVDTKALEEGIYFLKVYIEKAKFTYTAKFIRN
jgi:hypothetical protein